MSSFTMWVRDDNPDQTYLIALLLRVCKEQAHQVPPAFQAFGSGSSSRDLSYKVEKNYSKGGSNVTFTLS